MNKHACTWHVRYWILCLCLALAVACGEGAAPTVVDLGVQDVAVPETVEPDMRPPDLRPETVPSDGAVTDGNPSDQAGEVHDVVGPDADVVDLPEVWGWISAIEWNDVCDQWYLKTQWNGGVRAYFAQEPSFQRALPHTLGFCNAVATVGSCTLYDSGLMSDECLGMCMCLDKGVECNDTGPAGRWCEEDEVCVAGQSEPPEFDQGHCVPLPTHFQVGTVTLQGLKQPVAMTPDLLDRYIHIPANPNDLFDQGDTIVATTEGGDLPPLSFTAKGVAPLELANQVVSIRENQPSLVTWIPVDPDSRVQVYLAAGSHDPNPLGGAIVCDVPDSDGQVQIDYSLLQQLWYLGCDGSWLMKCSRITRYSRDVKQAGQQQVELFVGSARNLQMLFE